MQNFSYSKLGLLALFLMNLCAQDAKAVSLNESYENALKVNLINDLNQSRINEAIEFKNQSKGLYYPTLSARGNYTKQDTGTSSYQRTMGLNLSHTLYRGGRDANAVAFNEYGIEQAKNSSQMNKINLYMDVIQSYYTTYLNQKDLDNLDLLKKQSLERANEIKKRVQIGRSRRGELMQAEAQLASVEAQAMNGKGLVSESRETFAILTGLNGELVSKSEVSLPNSILPLDHYLDLVLKREDVKNKRLEVERETVNLKMAKNTHLPTLDLVSNYYLDKTGGTDSFRKSDWDIGVTLNFPLFEGGTTQAKVRESVAAKTFATSDLVVYERNVKSEVAARYETLNRFNNQIKAFSVALDKAKNSYDEALKDYRLGLVTNLDVLQSLNLYLDTKRNYDRVNIQAMMSYKMLEATVGVLP